ncbi:hypothetical protein VSX64_14575 [Aurantimonas sp. C2-6-R+9]|uniref:hypothetical protein n=1 Tax=unclassified Aurantimonas TaxID=2638230 RepID=UPI002E17050F|nr:MULTISPECIES: hypothetical protein [unclassified Aurantimonas]MEC5291981.1 hypothetical protein [Aurantimonas sp. C2-3-R2]MEC5382093.1 hypothetical protein [Aurantimonas sp. C2-6-R+9]MEC5413066.1 hypothetical protein [Aurantimonas sp. C2-4-R8]
MNDRSKSSGGKPGSNDGERFDIEVFRPGTFTPMSGNALSFSAEELSSVADVYDPENHPAPVVVGHPQSDAPAYGWAASFRYDGEGERLIATIGDLEPAFAEAVRAKRYRRISISFFMPDAPANPIPGVYYPRHIGFLGGAAPAVPGLKPVHFSAPIEDTVTIEFKDRGSFGEPGFRDSASLFRRCRDFFIDQFGLEKADEILPSYEIDWLERRADEDDGPKSFSALGKSAPPLSGKPLAGTPPHPSQESPVNTPTNDKGGADFAAREAEIERRERAHQEREAQARHREHEAFAEARIDEGRLLPASKAEAVALLDAVAGETLTELSFSDAEGRETKVQPVETLKSLMQAAPVVVTYGRTDLGAAPGAGGASFASPDNLTVDAAGLDTHAKATEYQRAHPDVAWLDAVRAVS